ncbi:T9SS type A sorting domain-containing protein [Gracilimonas tropica]|uniref:T9SS type A sorting domain-containing protein n=1 Tax=Gracilimonas tropica TaxID=454600 RepID=UPI00036734F0|nr:T9SS type A sorting domain-containing protein [Gracilimonas tropica]
MKNFKNLSITGFFLLISLPVIARQQIPEPAQIERKTLTPEEITQICELPFSSFDENEFQPYQSLRKNKSPGYKTATINADYVGGWPQEAIEAFEYAMDIWESHVTSSVPIRVEANWVALGEFTLGSAGPTQFLQLTPEDGQTAWYPIALASSVNGVDYVEQSQGTGDEVDYDITVNMNASFPAWYFGTDAQPPSGTYDFVTVVLHEVGHGLGFTGSMRESGGGSAQWGFGFPVAPLVYDLFVIDGQGNEVIDQSAYGNPSAGLYDAVTGRRQGLYFAGLKTIGEYDGRPTPLYAPREWAQGSSYSHLDYENFTGTPNALMRPQINSALAVHNPGPLVCTIFGDMGWPLGEDCAALAGNESKILVNNDATMEGINFGVTNEGELLRKIFTISNDASALDPLVARISVSGGDEFRVNTVQRFIVLEPGENIEVPVVYLPSSSGKRTATLNVTHNSSEVATPLRIKLEGEALESGTTFLLEQNYPNPFNATTMIPYALSTQANVRIDVYDVLGRHVQTLVNEEQSPGRYSQPFRADGLSSGMFIYRIVVDGKSDIGKLLYSK